MKKFLTILLFFVINITACSSVPKNAMSIKPSEFSEETEKVLKLFDDEVQFFDITLDETAKSYTISVWIYRDGDWTEDGSTTGGIELLNGQIALKLTDNSYDLYVIDENGHVKYSYPVLETEFEKSTGTGGSRIDSTTPIELNKETPVWVKIGTDKNSMKVMDITKDFRNSECNAGIAVTLTISDEVVD